MFKTLSAVCVLVIGLTASFPAPAQYGNYYYPPENLAALSYYERSRAIEDSYYRLSGGRRIPSDQLRFYLDRVESGWTLSRIESDIRASLARSSRSYDPYSSYPTQNPAQDTVLCASYENGYRECSLPFGGPVRLVSQESRARCVEGNTWGQIPGRVWVSGGCRARFAPYNGYNRYGYDNSDYAPASSSPGQSVIGSSLYVLCESIGSEYRQCPTDLIGATARLHRQESKTRCVEGQNWGYRPGAIWVSGGCRGTFVIERATYPSSSYYGSGYGSGGYSVTCSSQDNRFTVCAWNTAYGSPRLLEQLSKAACTAGRTWGYDPRGIWVNGGCRARFGP